METWFRFAYALCSISLKCFLEMIMFKRVSLCQQGQIVFFFSSNTVLFNVSFKTLDSCFKSSLFFHFTAITSNLSFVWVFSPMKLLDFFFSPMLQRNSNVPIDSFSTFHWLMEFQRWALKNRRCNHKMSLWMIREVCCRFSTKSSLFTENPLSTSTCPWDKLNTILKIVQHFQHLSFPCIRSTKKVSFKKNFMAPFFMDGVQLPQG